MLIDATVLTLVAIVACMAAFSAYQRRRLRALSWPRDMTFNGMYKRVEKYLKYRDWKVRRGYFPPPPEPSDYHFIVSHGSSEIVIYCNTSGMNSYIVSLRDFLNVRSRYQWGKGVQLVYVSADIVPLGRIIEARQSGIFVFHYRELAELCSLDPATPEAVAGMLDTKLNSRKEQLKLPHPAE